MSESYPSDAFPTGPEPAPGKIEAKTKFGAYATYAGAFVLFAILTNTTTDLTFLPDWLETLIYPLVPALASFAGSYLKSHKPGAMSLSAKRALGRFGS
jgi:hypothetical protein